MSIYRDVERVLLQDVGFQGYIMMPTDASSTKKYPVLYLIHGSGGVEEWFCPSQGNMPALIEDWAQGVSDDAHMIVVFPEIVDHSGQNGYRDYQKKISTYIPAIQQVYSDCMRCDCEHTAIAGFSLGGAFALYCAIKNSDLFYHVGAFSPSSFLYCSSGSHTSWLKLAEDLALPDRENSVRFLGSGNNEYEFQTATNLYYDTFAKNDTIFNNGDSPYVIPGGEHSFYTFNELLKRFLEKNMFDSL